MYFNSIKLLELMFGQIKLSTVLLCTFGAFGVLSSSLNPAYAQRVERIAERDEWMPDRKLVVPIDKYRIPKTLRFNNPSLNNLKATKKQLNLRSLVKYPSLSTFNSRGLSTKLSLGNSQVLLRPYLASPNSLSTIYSNLQNKVLPGSLKSNAEILRSSSTKGLVITEQLTFQPKMNTCSSKNIPSTCGRDKMRSLAKEIK